MMDSIFEGLISEGKVIVYLDDILIFTESLEHQEVVKKAVSLLHIHNLFLKPEKCKFKHTEIEYLRVIISHNSVCMDPIKVAGVSKWPVPSNKKEVQSFLGFTNFYQCFIQDFSHHAQPLSDLAERSLKHSISTMSLSSPTCQRVIKLLVVDGSSTSNLTVIRRPGF